MIGNVAFEALARGLFFACMSAARTVVG